MLVLERSENIKYWQRGKKAWVQNTALGFPSRSPMCVLLSLTMCRYCGLQASYLIFCPLFGSLLYPRLGSHPLLGQSTFPLLLWISHPVFNTLPYTEFLTASQHFPSTPLPRVKLGPWRTISPIARNFVKSELCFLTS